eukprot:7026138-Pyramimonas_sp.AAC.1
MHKITRLQKVRCLTVVEKASGVFSSSPEVVLIAEVEALQQQRNASFTPPRAHVPDRDCLPRDTAEEIRSASRMFCQFTPSTLDAFHPKHVRLLGGAGLETLSV